MPVQITGTDNMVKSFLKPIINVQLDQIASKSSIIFAVNLDGFSVNDSLGGGVTSKNAADTQVC